MLSAIGNALARSSRPAMGAQHHHYCHNQYHRALLFRRFAASSVPDAPGTSASHATEAGSSSSSGNNISNSNSSSSSSSSNNNNNNNNNPNTIRLSKLLSHDASNLALSRRQAERLIRDGAVTLAGDVVRSPQMLVDFKAIRSAARDRRPTIKVGGKPVLLDAALLFATNATGAKAAHSPLPRVWAVHKLKGEVVTEHDPHGRPSLLERLQQSGVGKVRGSKRKRATNSHLKPIGRLDMPTEGLILVTNDGGFAREMELPSSKIHRVYRARVHGRLTPHKLDQIRRGGVELDGVRYPPMHLALEKPKRARVSSTNTWLRVTCTEGKNRQVRNVFAALGVSVTRLIRIGYGDYELESIPPGMALPVPYKPIDKQRARGPLASQLAKAKQKRKRRMDDDAAPPVKWVTSIS